MHKRQKSKHNDGIEQIITGNYGNEVHFRSIKARKERRDFKILKYASDSNFYLIYCVGLYYVVKISTKATLRQNLASTAVALEHIFLLLLPFFSIFLVFA